MIAQFLIGALLAVGAAVILLAIFIVFRQSRLRSKPDAMMQVVGDAPSVSPVALEHWR